MNTGTDMHRMFELPSDVRAKIWARARFLRARATLKTLVRRRPQPRDVCRACWMATLRLSETRVMKLWCSWQLAAALVLSHDVWQDRRRVGVHLQEAHGSVVVTMYCQELVYNTDAPPFSYTSVVHDPDVMEV